MKRFALFILIVSSLAQANAAGDYPAVACDQPYFAANACNQCFDGGAIPAGTKLDGLYDSWTNPNDSEQVIYRDEQVRPNLVNLAGDKAMWSSNPADATAFWKYGSEIQWTGPADKLEFTLDAGKTVNIFEADFGANYTLDSSTAANGEVIGLTRFPVVYHDVDATSGVESEAKTHYECVAYKAQGGVAPETPKTPTKAIAKVKTGPEAWAFAAIAMMLSLGIIYTARRRHV